MKHRSSNSIRSVYDELYRQADYYGKALPEVLNYFERLPKTLSILDVGCGQGRYAIPLTKMGFEITVLDNCRPGIEQVRNRARDIGVPLSILECDAYNFENYARYDVIFISLFFQFNEFEKNKETDFIKNLMEGMPKCQSLALIGYKNDGIRKLILSLITATGKFATENDQIIKVNASDGASGLTSYQEYFFLVISRINDGDE